MTNTEIWLYIIWEKINCASEAVLQKQKKKTQWDELMPLIYSVIFIYWSTYLTQKCELETVHAKPFNTVNASFIEQILHYVQ